jgi:hypothetical protein
MLSDLRAQAVRTRWESFNRQLSAFRLGLGHQREADCHMAFSFRESFLPAAHVASPPAQEAPRAGRLRRGMKVLWRRDCEGDCRS